MKFLSLLLIALVVPSLLALDQTPDHPKNIKYPELKTQIPNRNDYKHKLDGATMFLVEDHSLPLINIVISARGGSYLDPQGKEGLANFTGNMLRNGGTQSLDPVAFQERTDFLSTNIATTFTDTQFRATLNCLTGNLKESLALFFDMLQNPRFDQERMEIERKNLLEEMRKRNDDTRFMEPRYWGRLVYGEKFYSNRMSTEESIKSITADDMRAFMKRILIKGNLVISVNGDVTPAALSAALNPLLAQLAKGQAPAAAPKDWAQAGAGLYGVQKDGVNQSRVTLGYLGLSHGNPDEGAVDVMNSILGGGGFSSRITSRVRSDEGLAYSAGSTFTAGYDRPGQFAAFYQSKNESVAYALKIVLEEIKRMREQPVTESELRIAQQGMVADLLPMFDSPAATVRQFARAEMENEPVDYWKKYQEAVSKTTITSIQAIAQKYLHPDKLMILVTGDLEACKPGDGHGTLEEVAGSSLKKLPLYDPMTGKALP